MGRPTHEGHEAGSGLAHDHDTGPVSERRILPLSSPPSLSSSAPAPLAPAPRAPLRSQVPTRISIPPIYLLSGLCSSSPSLSLSMFLPLGGNSPFFSSSVCRDSAAFLSRVSGLWVVPRAGDQEGGGWKALQSRFSTASRCALRLPYVSQLGCGISSITLRALGS